MASKARFQSKQGSMTKGNPGSISKGPSGNAKLQVFLNGKMVTPVSLLYSARSTAGSKDQAKGQSGEGSGMRPNLGEAKLSAETKEIKRVDSGRRTAPHARNRNKNKVEEMVTVEVEETETEIIFELTSQTAANDTRDVQVTEDRNKKYEELKKLHENPDAYLGRSSQTLNNPQKNQNEMVAPSALREMGSQAAAFEIDDDMRALVASEEDALIGGDGAAMTGDIDGHGLDSNVRQFIQDTVSMSEALPGCLLDPTTLSKPPNPADLLAKRRKAGGGGQGKSQMGISQTEVSQGGGNSDALAGGGGPSHSRVSGGGLAGGQSNTGAAAGGLGPPSASGVGGNLSAGGSGGQAMGTQTNFMEIDQDQVNMKRQTAAILANPNLRNDLDMLERAVQQNAFHRSHLNYRDLPDVEPLVLLKGDVLEDSSGPGGIGGGIGGGGFGGASFGGGLGGGIGGGGLNLGGLATDVDEDAKTADGDDVDEASEEEMDEETQEMSKRITRLFTFHSEGITNNRSVTAMCWNPANTDLLAVGYGLMEFGGQNTHNPGEELDEELQGGLVLFWSLRNPEHPEKILRTAQPVTSLDFSTLQPTILAVGCYNGDVLVYNLRREGDAWTKPIASSHSVPGGHVDPVWQMKWVRKANDSGETLVSISTDGAVLEWNLKKGLEVSTLMRLMRGGLGDGWISRQAAGLCIDFLPDDPSVYFVGTEDGAVHRCSVSYSEQYLGTYDPHHGPVYRIRCCDRWSEIFASCSADWNVSVYHSVSTKPLLSISATGESAAVNDVAWCPGNSTVLASVSDSGRLLIWDLEVSCIDPVVSWNTTRDVHERILNRHKKPEPKAEEGEPGDVEDGPPGTAGTAPSTAPGTAGTGAPLPPFVRHSEVKDEAASPVTKLLRNLSAATDEVPGAAGFEGTPRRLTSVLFGKRSPTVVVGDRRGIVTMYRIHNPVTVRQEGPKQQTARLQRAVLSQTDPAEVTRMAEKGHVYNISYDTPPPPAPAAVPSASEDVPPGEEAGDDESALTAAEGESAPAGEVAPPVAAE